MRKFRASKLLNNMDQIEAVKQQYYTLPESKPHEMVYFTDEELKQHTGTFVFDIEVYPNYFLALFKCVDTGKLVEFEVSPDSDINKPRLQWMLSKFTIVSFNGTNFDMPLLWMSIKTNSGPAELASACSTIIMQNARSQDIQKMYKFTIGNMYHHIDLIEVAPQSASLKLYGGRIHTDRMQDLPIDPNTAITQEEAELIKNYCVNDLNTTMDLWNELQGEIDLRRNMSSQYGIDLCSKSDAQIAEAVICNEIKKITGYYPKKANIEEGSSFKYIPPEFISFQTEQLQNALDIVKKCDFTLDGGGSPRMPETLSSLKISIGESVYKMGMGGLHSSEESRYHKADEKYLLADIDVTSYYPRIMLNSELYPAHLGKMFLKIFDDIVTKRIQAKRNGNRVVNESLKIVINGSFGKFGSKWSRLYSPDLMIQTTLTGQLSLLMLIELLELNGISVVSGNTDGIVVKCERSRKAELEGYVKMWESHTGFNMEYSFYKGVYSRDVNSYVAITEEGEAKAKGFYGGSISKRRLWKNPECLICNEALQQFLTDGTPIHETIDNCDDIRKFLKVRTVRGGARKDDCYLGKAIRWYYKKGEFGTINYVDGGNKVPTSDGAWPCMDLPDQLPKDIDYDWYVNRATEMLYEVGYLGDTHII